MNNKTEKNHIADDEGITIDTDGENANLALSDKKLGDTPDEEKSAINIYEKIQIAKKLLAEENIKKSGINTYSNFQYYELSDFMPSIIKIFNELKLFSKVAFTNELAMLSIINAENPTEQEQYTSPMKILEIKGANSMQALGGAETYQRRYLYMSALDITENDMFDANSGKDEKGGDIESNDKKNQPNEPVDDTTPDKKPTAKQLKRLYAIRSSVNMDEETLKRIIFKHYQKSSTEELTRVEYDFICEQLEAMKQKISA